MLERYKLCSVKLIVIIIVTVIGTAFFVMRIGDGAFHDWAEFVLKLVGILVAGNIASKFFKKKKKETDNGDKS